jgi:hypothetical protein
MSASLYDARMTVLLDPAILFFVFGLLAGALRSNLEIPPAISKFLSLYLLMALGLKGGFALAQSGLSAEVGKGLFAAIAMAVVVPILAFQVLKRCVSPLNAAAVAATYGSVSAVTFVTACQFLDQQGMAFSPHMTAALVVMESPAILLGVYWANALRRPAAITAASAPAGTSHLPASGHAPRPSFKHILHESFTEGAQLLLLGSMAVGYISGESGQAVMQPFSGDLFKGMLAFFLLDMGLTVARNFSQARRSPPWLLAYALIAPLVHASLALGLAVVLGMNAPDAALLMVLAASASYIAVPAVLRHAIPEANPSIYLGLSLGVTFPFNILVGITLYAEMARWALG